MPKTELGSLLISRELLTEEQLDRALDRQRNFGGRIGTCLLETGALSEDDLLTALSVQLQVPAATAWDLEEAPPELIELLPKAIALNCSAVPFGHSSGRVDVALLDAGDFVLEDELSFSIGKRIRPHIANELRIVDALHRYYGGDIPLRFRSLLDSLEVPPAPAEAAPLSPVPAYLRPGNSQSAPTRKRDFAPPKFDKQAIPLTPEERVALEASRVTRARQDADSVDLGSPDANREAYGLRLSEADTASQIGAALIQFLARRFPSILLFRVSSGSEEVTGWMSHGPELNLEWFRHYSVGLHHSTVFRGLSEGEGIFWGQLEKTPAHKALARCWDGSLERRCLLLPVSIRGKLICVAYADSAGQDLDESDLESLRKVCKKTALAFERCILRRKLQTG